MKFRKICNSIDGAHLIFENNVTVLFLFLFVCLFVFLNFWLQLYKISYVHFLKLSFFCLFVCLFSGPIICHPRVPQSTCRLGTSMDA